MKLCKCCARKRTPLTPIIHTRNGMEYQKVKLSLYLLTCTQKHKPGNRRTSWKTRQNLNLCATAYNGWGWETFEKQIYVVYENHDLPSKFFVHNSVIKRIKSDFVIWAVHFYASVHYRKGSRWIVVKQRSLYTKNVGNLNT